MRFLTCALCLAPALAWAGDELAPATKMLDQMNYRGALELARKVLKSGDRGPEELARAYGIEGLCLAALGRNEQAIQSFRRLLAIDPQHALSKDVSPKLARAFAAASSAKLRPRPLALEHQPPEVGESLGGTTLAATLKADDLQMVKVVRLRFRADQAQEQRLDFTVKGPGQASIPLPQKFAARRLSYFFEALNEHGSALARAGSPDHPFVLEVKPPVVAAAPPPRIEVVPAPPPLAELATEEEQPPPPPAPWYESWWFWTAVGAVVAGAVVATAVTLSDDGGDPARSYEIRFR